MIRTFMNLWIYVYPFPALIFFYFHWSKVENSNFAFFLIMVPVLYGYVMPGIAVNLLKKWKFNTKFRLGNYYAHHGFKISANINTSFFLTTYSGSLNNLTTPQMISLILATACVQAFIVWWHDTIIIKLGKLELNNVLVTPEMSPEQKAFAYAPACFFTMGASFALMALVARGYFIQNEPALLPMVLSILGGFIFLSGATSLVFGMLEARAKARRIKDV